MRGKLTADECLHFAVSHTGDEVDSEDAVIGGGGGERRHDRGIPQMWAEDIGFPRKVNIVYDNIELPRIVREPLVGVGNMDFDAGVVEPHVPTGEGDDFTVNVHRDEPRIGEEMAEDAEGGAAGEAEHEDGTGRGVSKQRAGGDHVPRKPGKESVAVEPGIGGSLDAEFRLDVGLPDFDGLPVRGGFFEELHGRRRIFADCGTDGHGNSSIFVTPRAHLCRLEHPSRFSADHCDEDQILSCCRGDRACSGGCSRRNQGDADWHADRVRRRRGCPALHGEYGGGGDWTLGAHGGIRGVAACRAGGGVEHRVRRRGVEDSF